MSLASMWLLFSLLSSSIYPLAVLHHFRTVLPKTSGKIIVRGKSRTVLRRPFRLKSGECLGLALVALLISKARLPRSMTVRAKRLPSTSAIPYCNFAAM